MRHSIEADGEYKIYIIKHIYHDKTNEKWATSDITQFGPDIPYAPASDQQMKLVQEFDDLSRPFSANGKCWQKTRIHGTYNEGEAIDLMNWLAKHNPTHRFGVFQLHIAQLYRKIAEVKYE
jgi:hypothetical protein